MKSDHILIIRFSALGDVAMTVPVVYSLAKQYPHLRIKVLSRPFARPFFENLAPNVGFMEADIKKEYHGVKGLNALYRRLTAKNFTAIADLHAVLRSEYLRMRFNLDRYHSAHIDKHRNGKRRLISSTEKQLVKQPSAFQNYADVFEKLGYPVKLGDFKSIFPETGGDLTTLPSVIGQKNDGDKWIGIAPFAAHEGKIYPIRLMEQVISNLISKDPHIRIFLFGKGEDEDKVFTEWCDRYKQCLYTRKYISQLYDELILMSHLDVMLSMDSANMHLASMVGTPVVSIWGATHPYAGFIGWNQSEDNIIQIDLPCRPCSIYGNKPCLRGDFACLKNISPEQIIERLRIVLLRKV